MPRKPIQDEFTNLAVSRQRKAQLRYARDGKCQICGKPRSPTSSSFCEAHEKSRRERARVLTGSKPWRAGGPGRPPKSA